MIHSAHFKANPQLFSFLPIFYMVWADAILTPSEIKNIRQIMDRQLWISPDERDFLLSFLDPLNPPKPHELKEWLNEIRKVAGTMSDDMKNSLVNIGIALARLNARNQDEESLEKARQPLTDLEEALGVLSREAAFHLRSAFRITQTEDLASDASFDTGMMNRILDGREHELIQKVKTIISDPAFAYFRGEEKAAYREQVLKWCQYLAEQGFGARAYPKSCGGAADMSGYFAIMEALSYHDLSMVIKFGVQFGLFGMSIYFLGTEKHHEQYLQKAGTLELPGCFAMTETGHGSNVKGIETTATYTHKDRQFIIHTPHESAGKEYIGNAAVHGQMATVFAKLIIDGTDYRGKRLFGTDKNTGRKTGGGCTN